jgi:stage II sporulation protein P
MKRRNKLKIYPILWTGITIASILLLVRFLSLTLSDHVGQAEVSLKTALVTGVYKNAMESGSSLMKYMEVEEYADQFPIDFVSKGFALWKFTSTDTVVTAEANEYAALFKNGNPSNNIQKPEDDLAVQTWNNNRIHENIGFSNIVKGNLSKEYIISNGSVYNNRIEIASSGLQDKSDNPDQEADELEIGYTKGEVYFEETEDDTPKENVLEALNENGIANYTLEQLKDINFLIQHFYIVDSTTKVTEKLFNAEQLLGKDMTIKQENDAPQILIYHTHSQEAYADSRQGEASDTVVGAGNELTEILENQYGYNVIHDTSKYDMVDGKTNRNDAYNRAKTGITRILRENPTIEVVIDLHRDSGEARYTTLNGKQTAKIMLFNGLSRDQNGPITYLENPNLQDNLAFSLQLQLKALDLYPGLFHRNYLKSYRYNMHVRPKSILMELGTYKNSVQSAKNAMEPFAKVLDAVLQGE